MARSLPRTVDDFNRISNGRFPGFVGLDVVAVEDGHVEIAVDIAEHHIAPNGFLHAGVVVTLADTACGYGTVRTLPDDATGFATIELKTNFLGTALRGRVTCDAKLVHGGKRTQVWDATVTGPDGRTMALFRCTQTILRSG